MSRRLSIKPKRSLTEIMQEIDESQIDHKWSIHLSTVLVAVDESIESFYRFFYQSRASEIPDVFTDSNVELLIQFLSYLGLANVENEFRKRGLYLNNEDCLIWKELFLSVSLNYLFSHRIDESDLEISVSGCKNLTDGFEFYCDLQCPIDELIERAAVIYCQHHSLPYTLKTQLIDYIGLLFERGYLQKKFLYNEFYCRLHQLCKERGWCLDIHNTGYNVVYELQHEIKAELSLLGFNSLPTIEELKDRYRTLLKENHPDIKRTKEATAKTVAINEAYTKIYAMSELK